MGILLAIIFGGAIAVFVYETYFEKKEKKIGELLAPKAEELIEISSRKIAIKQKEINRRLTDDEKNKICDECYNEM